MTVADVAKSLAENFVDRGTVTVAVADLWAIHHMADGVFQNAYDPDVAETALRMIGELIFKVASDLDEALRRDEARYIDEIFLD